VNQFRDVGKFNNGSFDMSKPRRIKPHFPTFPQISPREKQLVLTTIFPQVVFHMKEVLKLG
jgi:hypothetical protein